MTKTMMRGALALPLLLAAPVALADEAASDTTAEIVALGLRADAHGPAGTMGEHVHKSGDVMVGLMWMHESYGGANRTGTTALSDEAVAAAGYTAKADAMTMDMAMLHIMVAPSDRVTLMVVPSWMRMGMTMKGLPGDHEGGGHGGHHALMPGETAHHSTSGIGDTQIGAVLALSRRPALSVLASVMVSAPTGKVTRKNADGTYVHYMMQGGSGTWDLNPSLTLRGQAEGFSWGVQAGYLFRAEKANAAGFRFGDRFATTAWLAKPLSPRLSLSARAQYSDEGPIKGHYNGSHSHAAPPDRQRNYGGRRLELGLGGNLVIGDRLRLGAEASVPVYQHVNGIQPPKRFGANLSASVMF
jgi:hypothetical protein